MIPIAEADIVVIGAGIAGALAAWALAEGRRVVLLEAEDRPGYHATGRSAAIYVEAYGNVTIQSLTRASRAFLLKPPAGFADTPLLRPRGMLYRAAHGQEAALETLMAGSHGMERLTGGDAAARLPILRPEALYGAAYDDAVHDMDVDALHQGYLRGFRRRGGRLVTGAAPRSVARHAGCWTIETGEERLRAPVIVNAAGAWADAVAVLSGVAPLGVRPLRRTALLVPPPDDTDPSGWPASVDVGETLIFKPDAGLVFVSPVDETPSDPCDAQPEEIDVAVAVDRMEGVTTLRIGRVARAWAGLRCFAPDRSPLIGFDPSAPGFFWVAGLGGYGIQTAPACAALIAALVDGRAMPGSLAREGVSADVLSPARFRAGG